MSTPPSLDEHLCFALYSASRAITAAERPGLQELGLTYPQYLVMLVLWEADGDVTVSQIGHRLALDSGTLSPLLKRLQTLGLIERARSAEDERSVLVSLTESGSQMRMRAGCVVAAAITADAPLDDEPSHDGDEFTVDELEELRDALNRLTNVLRHKTVARR